MTTLDRAADAGNTRGILAMLVSMACFTINDTFIKIAASDLPLGEIIFVRNAFAVLVIAAWAVAIGGVTLPCRLPARLLVLRLVGEVSGTLLFLNALVRMPIADATAIGQFTPLAVTAAAAIFLKEPVGWRRWLAAGVGLLGVLLIVRPGTTAFTPAALFVVASMAFVVLRDLATRGIAASVPTVWLTAMSAVAVMLSSLLLLPYETWQWPAGRELLMIGAAGAFLTGGYAFIVVAMRSGEIPVVAPFRYSVIVWALVSGAAVWGQIPDALSLCGIAIVCGAGLYAFHRERIRRRQGW